MLSERKEAEILKRRIEKILNMHKLKILSLEKKRRTRHTPVPRGRTRE